MSADDFEAVAQQRGWETKRNDGSLNAGVVRYRSGGFQWAGNWKEACSIDGLSGDDVCRLASVPPLKLGAQS